MNPTLQRSPRFCTCRWEELESDLWCSLSDMRPLLCILNGKKTESLKSGNRLLFTSFTLFYFYFLLKMVHQLWLWRRSLLRPFLCIFPLPALSTGTKAATSTDAVWFLLRSTCNFWHSLFKVTILTPAQCLCAFFDIKADSEVHFNQLYTRMHAADWFIHRLVSPLAYFNFILLTFFLKVHDF